MAEVTVRFNGHRVSLPVPGGGTGESASRVKACEAVPRFGALYGVLALDDCGIVVSTNAAAERIFGRPAGELIGQSVATLLPVTLDEGISIDWLACEVTQLAGLRCDVVAHAAGGRAVPVHMAIRRLQRDGRPLLAVVLRELTAGEVQERGYRGLSRRREAAVAH